MKFTPTISSYQLGASLKTSDAETNNQLTYKEDTMNSHHIKGIKGGSMLKRIMFIMLVLLTASTAFAVGPPTVMFPDYSQPMLTPDSQITTSWTNVIPNALASYYTYVPFSNADAVALGFPSSCGNLSLPSAGDQNSTEDCYTITVQKVTQQLALPGIFGGGAGLLDQTGSPFGAVTKGYAYGSGGVNWTPPGASVAVTGNAPKPFVDGTYGTAGIWHFPSPTLRASKGRPIRVQWLNELPNERPTGHDPTVDGGPNAPNNYPYNRIVTHVHGAHVMDDSDGYAEAWYSPGFALKGTGWVPSVYGPEGTYRYPMDQEAATLWYHDHASGLTHINTQMGMAGFFPVTDANEISLITGSVLPSGNYELGFALQDRVFDTLGQFSMPDYPVYNTNVPGCTLTIDGLPDPVTCAAGLQQFMKAVDGHLIPYVPGDPLLSNPNNVGAPFPAASTSLEYFGNMPMVNGVTYGKYDVEPRVYRMRFIGGSDSRSWVMQMVRRDTLAVVPFWQIGSEQGLLPNPVQRTTIDIMPGERIDVLVDLTGIPVGTKIVVQNLGPDIPYQGPGNPLPPSVDIPEIMEFDVIALNGVDTIVTPSAATVLRPAIAPLVPTPGTPVRNVSLMEITDQFGRTLPTIDSRGFMTMGIPITEVIRLNDTEEWDIINTTMDAHPMHLHLVAFQVISRQTFTNFVPPVNDIVNQIFTQPTYSNLGPAIPPDAWEAGWKDTVDVPPGTVTRIRAKFDIAGTKYVWHCHILSHEEHDMMRPMMVSVPTATVAPTALTFPDTLVTSTSATQTVSVINNGFVPVVINSIGTSGANAGQFALTTTCPLTITGLASGGSCTISVSFVPATLGAKSASVDITLASPGVSISIPVNGMGLAPVATVSTASLAFNNQIVNTNSVAQTVTLSNTGNSTLSINSISLNGVAPGQFGQTTTCGSTLAASNSCTVSVTFDPTTSGAKSATLDVNVVAPAVSQSVTLSGTGTAPTLAPNIASPQLVGTSITFTAGGIGNYEYKFWLRTGGVWSSVQAYSPTTTWTWDTTSASAGSYEVLVYIRSIGSVATYQAIKSLTYALIDEAPATGVSLSPDLASPRLVGNNNITFTANGSGGTGDYEYQFLLKTGGTWTQKQAYSTDNTWTWNTLGAPAGTYGVQVNVRNTGSAAKSEASKNFSYVLIASTPATGATLSPSVASPQTAGASVTFTAGGVGGSGSYEYKFWLKTAGVWTVVQGYSTTNTWTWDTTGLAPGTYRVQVDVRNVGSIAKSEAVMGRGYVIK